MGHQFVSGDKIYGPYLSSIYTNGGVFSGCGATPSSMTVTIAAGSLILSNVTRTTSSTPISISSDLTYPKITLIYMNSSGTITSVSGTAAATPVPPALDPDTNLLLHLVYVPAGATVINSTNIYDARRWITQSYTPDESTITSSSYVMSLADGAVTTSKLGNTAVTTPKIADGNVTTIKIADSNITTAKIADANVTGAKISTGGVGTTNLADSSVTTAKIADANVTTAKLATSAVGTTNIADLAVTAAKIANATITGSKLVDSTITSTQLGSNSVTTAKITDSNVTTAKIADGNITTAKIADANVTVAKLSDIVKRKEGLISTNSTIAINSGSSITITKRTGSTQGSGTTTLTSQITIGGTSISIDETGDYSKTTTIDISNPSSIAISESYT